MKSQKCILFLFLILPVWAFAQPQILLPVSAPDKAVEQYEEAVMHAWNADWQKFLNQMDLLLEDRPDFFMAHVQVIFASRHINNKDRVKDHLVKALEASGEMNEGEQIIHNALTKMQENADADLSGYWRQLIERYPTTVESYGLLYMENAHHNRSSENGKVIEDMLALAPDFGPLYNMKGYHALGKEDFETAGQAFDTYIELCPKLPNPYDSKGDYYMAVENYEMAAQSYMTAYDRDNTWTASRDRANEANSLMDQQGAEERESGKNK